MTIKELETAIEHQFDTGRYHATGADGGVLRYIMVNINGKNYHASITLDHEIAQIRRIWELSEVGGDELYDMTDDYYKLRG